MIEQRNELSVGNSKFIRNLSRLQNSAFNLSCGILIIVILGTFSIFLYEDMIDTYDNSILFIKAVLKGELRQFYSYTIVNNRSFWAANYESMIYLIYGIWNLPILVISHFLGVSHMDLPFGLMWCKLFGVICTFLTMLVMKKILALSGLNEEQRRWIPVLYYTNASLYVVVFMLAQVDCFAILLIMLGLYYYLRKESIKFVIFFAIAMPCKMFALFLFLPLLFLREKRVLRIIANLFVVCSLSILFRLYFGQDPAYSFALGSQSRDAIIQIADSSFYWGHQIILFVVVYMLLCAFCYVTKSFTEGSMDYEIPIYIAFAVWAGFILCVDFNSYWGLYLIPFMEMSIIRAAGNRKILTFLEMFFSVGYFGNLLFNCGPLSDPYLGHHLAAVILPEVFPTYKETQYGTLRALATEFGIDFVAPYFTSMMAGALIILLILLCPYYYRTKDPDESFDPNVVVVRIAMIVGIFLVCLYANFRRMPATVFSTLSANKVILESNILQGETEIRQNFESEQSQELHYLELFFSNPGYVRNNFSSVRIELLDFQGDSLYSERVGCSMIKPDQKLRLKVRTKVEKGELYTIRIVGIPGAYMDRKNGRALYPYTTEKIYDEEHPMLINGVETNTNLYFRLY